MNKNHYISKDFTIKNSRGVLKPRFRVLKYKINTPPVEVGNLYVKDGMLYAEQLTIRPSTISVEKNKLDKTSIKFYSTMIFLWIMLLIASWMQHIFIFILCESVSVAVVCLIIRRRIKKKFKVQQDKLE